MLLFMIICCRSFLFMLRLSLVIKERFILTRNAGNGLVVDGLHSLFDILTLYYGYFDQLFMYLINKMSG
jgi:hypothetical protein